MRKYEVFLSLRGKDTRKSFTDHLYAALLQAQIHTFKDERTQKRKKYRERTAKGDKRKCIYKFFISENDDRSKIEAPKMHKNNSRRGFAGSRSNSLLDFGEIPRTSQIGLFSTCRHMSSSSEDIMIVVEEAVSQASYMSNVAVVAAVLQSSQVFLICSLYIDALKNKQPVLAEFELQEWLSEPKQDRRPLQLLCKYEVFLSFQGKDTLKSFTDHLCAALLQAQIHTFKDEHPLERGKNIGNELQKAIKESEIALVVFSRNYAESKWCLDELVGMMEKTGLLVIPVFYDLKSSDVRSQTGRVGDVFLKHEECESKEKVDSWMAARWNGLTK